MTIVPPPGYEWPNYITTTFRFSKAVAPGTGVANFTFCLKKPTDTQFTKVLDCPKNLKESVAAVHLEAEPQRRRRARHGSAAHVVGPRRPGSAKLGLQAVDGRARDLLDTQAVEQVTALG